MLVAWRYRERKHSFIQWFDPRAWLIFYGCFLFGTLAFWDIRFLMIFFFIAMFVLFTSGVKWHEIRRAIYFIIGFIFFYSMLTFLTGRGGAELYHQEAVIRQFKAGFSILGWTPTLTVTVERSFFAFTQFIRVFSIAIMSILIPYSLNPALYGVTFKGLGLSDSLSYAMDLTMRFIPTFGRDFQLTMDAQRARGYEMESVRGGLFEQVRKLGPLMVPVTIHAIIGSEDIVDAMDLRAFGIGPRRWLPVLTYQFHDRVLIAFAIVLLVGSLVLGFLGYGKFYVPPSAYTIMLGR